MILVDVLRLSERLGVEEGHLRSLKGISYTKT